MTKAQQAALDFFSPEYCLPVLRPISFSEVFQREALCHLEIGFGSGQSLLAAAEAFPERNFIGIETHLPGVGALLHHLQKKSITNVRIIHGDAVEVLQKNILDGSLDAVHIFFPDPWVKRKHHKRRLVHGPFIQLLVRKLRARGVLHLATDWEDYAMQMMAVLSSFASLQNVAGLGQFAERSPFRPLITKFEQRGHAVGHKIWDLQFQQL